MEEIRVEINLEGNLSSRCIDDPRLQRDGIGGHK
jgi:hypothetical protein